MGMAASQARFLGLTARKTNTEYEGQQVNQQRTALSNESAALYNKLMGLTVPVPPTVSDYYTSTYSFTGKDGSNCQIASYTGGADNKYSVTVKTIKDVISYGELTNINGGTAPTTTIHKKTENNQTSYYITKAGSNTQYGISEITDPGNLPGKYYTYTINNIPYCILDSTFNGYMENQNEYSGEIMAQIGSTSKEITISSPTEANMYKNAAGRFEYIEFADQSTYPSGTLPLSLSQETNQEAYEQAMQDYNYQKMIYEKSVADINAKTEVIQQEDRTLELRLKELDTERNALQTEMDAVKEVIKKNVESTFKTFA